ncbi:MAG: hypothetical protein JSW65_04610 [Candidatus Bipolaricaulota bacterium]|nr:MAG: hypothetical protein JSW65_04610 [Candidatus Bipolaricaulota bacterium]
MFTISDLRQQLGLSTSHQVRNRIEAIRDALTPHLRRGPNNQLLVEPPGVEMLKRLQELHDSGLTLSEASAMIRSRAYGESTALTTVSPTTWRNRPVQRSSSAPEFVELLRDEIRFLRQRLAALEDVRSRPSEEVALRWWEALQEEMDGA